MTLPAALTAPLTFWQKLNAYAKHAVAVAAGIAISLGILDPATHEIHVSGLHSLYIVLIATGISLALSYAGLGAPSVPKVVYVATPPAAMPPPAVLAAPEALPAPIPAAPATLPPPIGP